MCLCVKERKRESVFDWREWESTKEALCTVTALRYKRDIICPEKNGWTRHSSTLWRPPMAKTRCPISRSTPSGRAKRERENAWEKERVSFTQKYQLVDEIKNEICNSWLFSWFRRNLISVPKTLTDKILFSRAQSPQNLKYLLSQSKLLFYSIRQGHNDFLHFCLHIRLESYCEWLKMWIRILFQRGRMLGLGQCHVNI